ncbi:MAG: ribonuclease H-like domain-containing protein [Clostridium sp.]
MITIEKKLQLPDTYPLERIGKLEDLLFFDIETTGFSGDRCQLYLIGCTYYKDNTWNLIQWFCRYQIG